MIAIPNKTKRGARRRVTQTKSPANGSRGPNFPPQITSSIQIDKTIRFKASSALSDASVNVNDLHDVLCMAVTATSAYRLPRTVKLRKIEAWAPPDNVGASVTLSVEDVLTIGGFSAPSRRVEDVTMGQSRPAHVVWTPKNDSPLSKWLSNLSASALILNAPTGTTFDVSLSYILQDGESPIAVSAAVAGATVGQMYIRSLNSTGSNNLPPVSYSTI